MKRFLLFSLTFACFNGTLLAVDSLQQKVNLHFQATYIYQYKPAFNTPYESAHSINGKEEKDNSLTATMYVGLKLWKGAELYFNPEIAGGSGLSGAFGMAASTNGETFRVGEPAPTLYLARGYFRQVFALGSNSDTLEDAQNQLRGAQSSRNLSITVGKFSLGDFFDNNDYSNSPKTQFINWALMSNSAWDYAANLRGYTVGAVAALKYDNTIYKIGVAALPKVANGADLNTDYGMAHGINAEVVRTYQLRKREGHVRVLAYYNETNMGLYSQALHTIDSSNRPDVIMTEKFGRSKKGVCINADQKLTGNLSAFARLGWNDGKTETWAFTEVDRTVSLGFSINGQAWKRNRDNVGVAVVMNGLSAEHKDYLAAGGYGFQLGDGKLNYAPETVAELYYNYKPLNYGIWMTGDYQFGMNPGYNKDRGPIQVFSFRVHVEL